MPSVLVIIDRPFRGALERQFADAVHLARVATLQFGTATILLTAEGVLLAAVAGASAPSEPRADAPGADSGRTVPGAQLGAESLLAAVTTGVPVLIDARAAELFGVSATTLERFELAPPPRVLEALTTHDHVWYA